MAVALHPADFPDWLSSSLLVKLRWEEIRDKDATRPPISPSCRLLFLLAYEVHASLRRRIQHSVQTQHQFNPVSGRLCLPSGRFSHSHPAVLARVVASSRFHLSHYHSWSHARATRRNIGPSNVQLSTCRLQLQCACCPGSRQPLGVRRLGRARKTRQTGSFHSLVPTRCP